MHLRAVSWKERCAAWSALFEARRTHSGWPASTGLRSGDGNLSISMQPLWAIRREVDDRNGAHILRLPCLHRGCETRVFLGRPRADLESDRRPPSAGRADPRGPARDLRSAAARKGGTAPTPRDLAVAAPLRPVATTPVVVPAQPDNRARSPVQERGMRIRHARGSLQCGPEQVDA